MSDYSALPATAQASFPQHGWIESVHGVRQLRLPLLRLFQFEEPHHSVYVRNNLAGFWLQTHSPYASIRMLAVSLRDLGAEFRVILPALEDEWASRPPSDERNRVLTRYREALERSEVFLVAAFVLLRRLADEIIDATRPLFFVDWHSAPRQMSKAIAFAKSGDFRLLSPSCDADRFRAALIKQTKWFEDLRQEDGVRDILVHKEHFFRVSAQGSKAPDEKQVSWRMTADLMRLKRGEIVNVDVLPVLRACICGLCDFMEQVYLSLSSANCYVQGDTVFLTGNDEDTTLFWPWIGRGASGGA